MQPVGTEITFVMLVYHHLPKLRSLLKHNSVDRWMLLLPDNEMRYVIASTAFCIEDSPREIGSPGSHE